MFIEIKPLEKFSYNCYEGSVASVAKAWNCDFELAYAKGWDFINLSQLTSIADCYNVLGKTFIRVEDVLNLSNIKTENSNDLSYQSAIDLIKKELLNNRPILASIDISVCPWFNIENTGVHASHGILIIGLDDDFLYCTDVSKMLYKGCLSYDNFKNGFLGEVTTFLKEDNTNLPLKKYDYVTSILESSQRMKGLLDGLNRFESMRKFSDIFIDLYMIAREEVESFIDKNFYATKLYIHIVNIMQDRSLYSRLAGIIGKKFSDEFYIDISKRLGEANDTWYKSLIMLIKAHLAGGDINILKQITNIINNNIEIEKKIAIDIINNYSLYDNEVLSS